MISLFETDKAGFLSSPDQVCEHYHEDGAVLIRGIIPEELLVQLKDQIARLITLLEHRWGVNSDIPAITISDVSKRLLRLEQYHPGTQSILYDAMSNMPILHQVAAHDSITALISRILSTDIAIHPRLIMLMSVPGEKWHLAHWHQDYYYNGRPEDTVTLYAPLQETTTHNGSLLLAMGAHKNSHLPHADHGNGIRTKWHTIHSEIVNNFNNIVETSVGTGDVLLLHSLMPHSAQLNASEEVRFVLNLRYQDLTNQDYLIGDWRRDKNTSATQALNRKEQG